MTPSAPFAIELCPTGFDHNGEWVKPGFVLIDRTRCRSIDGHPKLSRPEVEWLINELRATLDGTEHDPRDDYGLVAQVRAPQGGVTWAHHFEGQSVSALLVAINDSLDLECADGIEIAITRGSGSAA